MESSNSEKMALKYGLLILSISASVISCRVTRTLPQTATAPAIAFESAGAAKTFYEAVLDEQFPDPEGRSLTLALAPFDIEKENVRDSGSILSDAVSRADSNADGRITEREAKSFAAAVGG